ncbi:MAG: hypothetical protein AAF733_00175 [Verrucomicrobiota bacterium]
MPFDGGICDRYNDAMVTLLLCGRIRWITAALVGWITLTGDANLPAAEGNEKPEEPAFVFETGSPPWTGERIVLPPDFARDLGWTGVEEIRFAPGMFEAGQPDFFSYILVFLLEPGSDVSEEGLQRELLTYYAGLSKAVMASRKLSVDTSGFTVSIQQDERATDVPAAAPEALLWKATLEWIEPFATRERQSLHFELHTWEHEGQPVVLTLASPVAPDSEEEDSPWAALREIRASFRLE